VPAPTAPVGDSKFSHQTIYDKPPRHGFNAALSQKVRRQSLKIHRTDRHAVQPQHQYAPPSGNMDNNWRKSIESTVFS
jgi:hypothetical protein